MKNLLFLLLMAPLMSMSQFGIKDISQALAKGDASSLGNHFDQSVEISILDDVNIYDKSEAVSTLSSFFKKYPPNGCSQVHEGSSKGKNSKYTILSLSTDSQKFRVFLYMKSIGSKEVIQELSIDKE